MLPPAIPTVVVEGPDPLITGADVESGYWLKLAHILPTPTNSPTYQSSRLVGVPLFGPLDPLLSHLQKCRKNQYLCRFKALSHLAHLTHHNLIQKSMY